jgi:hypothetical protein
MATTTCDKCGHEIEHGEWPYCPHDRTRARRFTPVEVDLGSLGKHTIGSIQDADRLQRMAKDRGQEISFRAFNNDPSNQDRNSLGENRQADFKTRNRRGIPFISRRGIK